MAILVCWRLFFQFSVTKAFSALIIVGTMTSFARIIALNAGILGAFFANIISL